MIGTLGPSSTYDLLSTRRTQIREIQDRLNNASLEVATGVKADVYKSLGFGSTEVLALRAQVERNEGFIASNQLLSSKLDVTASTLNGIRSIAQSFLNDVTPNVNAPTASAPDLQAAAISALEQLTGQLNSTYQGVAIFSGIDSDQRSLQGWNQADATTGLSPSDVLASVIGAGFTGATDATNKANAIVDIFANADVAQPDRNFEATFYNGAPLLQSGGASTPRLQAQIDKNTTLEYGIQANDQAFRDVMRGLSMIASTDVSAISDGAAYEVWMSNAVDALGQGVSGLIEVESKLGGQQQQVSAKIAAQQNLGDIFNARVNDLEGVDLFEAASRVIELETQLQATYTVTSRLSQLSFLDYM